MQQWVSNQEKIDKIYNNFQVKNNVNYNKINFII